MPITKQVVPTYTKTPNGLMKSGYEVVQTITNDKGEIIKVQTTRKKTYKY